MYNLKNTVNTLFAEEVHTVDYVTYMYSELRKEGNGRIRSAFEAIIDYIEWGQVDLGIQELEPKGRSRVIAKCRQFLGEIGELERELVGRFNVLRKSFDRDKKIVEIRDYRRLPK